MKSPNDLSFLPDDYLERKQQRRTNTIFAVLFLTEMVAIGGAFSYTERSMVNVETMHTRLDADYADAAKRIAQVQQMQDKQRQMSQQAELSAALLEKIPRSFLLAELTNALPSGVSLTDFVMESKLRAAPAPTGPQTAFEKRQAAEARKVVVPQAKVYDVVMKVTGLADNDVQVAQFITKLNRSKMLRDVNLVYTDTSKGDEQTKDMRKFQMEMAIDPGADVQASNLKPVSAAVELK